MIDKNIDQIEVADIKAIVESNVTEKKTLEFKAILPGTSHSNKREFLADVSSFANTEGGYIIFGVDESSIGQEIVSEDIGFEVGDIDSEKSRLENLLRQAIAPRMNYDIGVIANNNKFILVIRIDPSLDAPHRVTLESHDKFYRRNSNGKYPMDVGELRTSFIKTSNLIDNVKGFVNKRVFDIQASDTPLIISNNSNFLSIHILPLSAFTTEHKLSNATILSLSEGGNDKFRPFYNSGWSHRINMEGVAAYSASNDDNDTIRTYTQLYRDGKIEAVEASGLMARETEGEPTPIIPMVWLESSVMKYVASMVELLVELSFKPPFYVYLTLFGIKGFKVSIPGPFPFRDALPIITNDLRLPAVIIDREDFNPAEKFQSVFDIIWNASGISRSLNFDDDGNYNRE